MFQDLRYALRTLSRSPGLVAAAVICLALGIGANATIFGVVDTLLFRAPPHVQDPDRVVRLYFRQTYPGMGTFTSNITGYPLYTLLRDSARALESVAAFNYPFGASVGRGADARRVDAVLASATLFPLLGVRPAIGRFYGIDEDRIGGPAVAVLGYGFWRGAFGGDSGVVGRRLQLGRGSYEIIGVAPERFTGVNLHNVDIWVPMAAATVELRGPGALNRGSYFLQIVGRLRAVADRATAQREATLLFRAENAYSNGDSSGVALLAPIQHARGPELSENVRVSLWLAVVAVIVLLVACANVANLLLARALTRQREVAVRLALGSGWWRLTRQILAESVVLAIWGGTAAVLVAFWAGPLIRKFLLPDVAALAGALDGRVVLFTAVIAILTGLLAGAVPAWQLRRGSITPALKAGVGEGRYQRSRLRAGLLVGQIALTVVLIVGAGLFARSLKNVLGQNFGFDPAQTLVATTDLRAAGYSTADMNHAYLRMLERVETLPGIQSAAATIGHPFRWAVGCSVSVPGRDSIPRLSTGGPYCQRITPGYFAAMGTPVRGRSFRPADRNAPVAIINATMARLVWPGENAIGKCFVMDKVCLEIVGIVPDARRFNAVEDASLHFYIPFTGDSDEFITAIVARVRGRPESHVAPVRAAMQSSVANLPYADVRPLADLVAPSTRPWRMGSTMFGAFALLALVLSAVGLYGVLAYTVAQRTHEMGVRLAMGAQHGDVVRLMVQHGVGIAALGAVIGAVIALATGRVLASLMFGVSPRDPLVLFVAALMPIAIAILASYIPARRAARVDPVTALRYE